MPKELSLQALSKVRARFIAEQGWGTPEEVRSSFTERNRVLQSFRRYKKVILWFEHDLYDQLQLLQLLDWFSENPLGDTELTLICTEQYLGRASVETMHDLKRHEQPITQAHLKLARLGWMAFRSASSDKWQGLLNMDLSALPFLRGAVIRFLEDYPNCSNGLSRSARQALEVVARGEIRAGHLFGICQDFEERVFMGDTSFWGILHAMLDSKSPLLEMKGGKALTLPTSPDQVICITEIGKDVLDAKKNWLDIVEFDQWFGGVHLVHGDIWCWDSVRSLLVKRG